MFKFFRMLCVVAFALFIVSCSTYKSSAEYHIAQWQAEFHAKFLSKSRFYSEVEPTGNQTKARVTVIQIGASDVNVKMRIYDEATHYDNGGLVPFRFGDTEAVTPVTDIHGVTVLGDYVKPLNQINVIPNKPFIFGFTVGMSTKVEPGWFRQGYTKFFVCNGINRAFEFTPEAGKDYLFSVGAKPAQDENYHLCLLKLEEWDKRTKQYKKIPFILYAKK
ncbi:hypothetical protein A9G29_04160 [Gilliamella sp. Fer2-1]|jgi:hypothetical protein|uniref:hypothetical protein n=1 Tax=unclassified Gilliamella TaxID=2685620 RepID=UPI00080E6CEF|nr:hypothetical protein [Gilliamella apicola]OCG23338.1 hypothetical protein A9G46_10360 [Gilliamella apicola]OCG27572.1 hypothetical protein A9G45_09470 [Gilliamella apicola]OCG33493.1 hypothetical protein A9G29_04160 [Gilliamella apicola]